MAKIFNRTNSNTAKKTLAIYWDEMVKDKKSVAQYIILIPLNRLLYIVILPLIFSLVIQSLIENPDDREYPFMLLGIAVLVSIAALVAAQIGFKRLFRHEEQMRTALTERAITSLVHHSDQFFANRKIGSLAGDVNTFSGSIITFLDTAFLSASGIAINFVASLIIIAILSPVLLIPLGTVTLVLVVLSVRATIRRGPFRHKRKTLMSQLNGTIADILGNQQIVRFFATSNRETARVLQDRSYIEEIARHEVDIIQSESILRQGILFAFQIATLAICVIFFTSNLISIAALVFAVTYLGRLTSSMFELTPLIRNTEQAFLDAANITDILDEMPEVIDKAGAASLHVSAGSIEFNHVNFAYKDNEHDTVLHDLSLTIAPGERIGLAGPSGGGKTTLTKLILRFADVASGSIKIDGQNITDVTQASLRKNIAYVPQEPYLFHRSLKENIAYGRPDASDMEIMRAIEQANAHEFVTKLPLGLETVIGERGIKLSGGQRQRIAIARAILKDSPILVLDEATSALDSESERLIQDSLAKLMKNRTSIVIAHRLSTIANLDRIIVLENGKITEDGSHAALLRKNGAYTNFWKHQSGGFIEE